MKLKAKKIKAWAVIANNRTIQTDAFYNWQQSRSFYLISRSKKEANYWVYHFKNLIGTFKVAPVIIEIKM